MHRINICVLLIFIADTDHIGQSASSNIIKFNDLFFKAHLNLSLRLILTFIPLLRISKVFKC